MKKKKVEHRVEAQFFGSLSILLIVVSLSLFLFLTFRTKPSFYTGEIQGDLVVETDVQKKSDKKEAKVQVAESSKIDKNLSNSNQEGIKSQEYVSASNGKTSSESGKLSEREIELMLGNVGEYVSQGMIAEARAILQKILESNPDHEEALTQLGLIYTMDLQKENEAREVFEKLLMKNPQNPVAIRELEDLNSDHSEGVKKMESIYQKDPNPELAVGIGHILMDRDDPSAAIPYFEKAGEKGLSELAEVYIRSNNVAKAQEVMQKKEDILTQKLQSADAEHHDELVEELVRAKLNQVEMMMRQPGKEAQSRQKIMELKGHVKDSELQVYLNAYDSRRKTEF